MGATVLITGAGGYIGSALARSIAAAGPAQILLLDSSEHNLFGIHSYLADAYPGVARQAILGSVGDAALVNDVLRRFRPSTIYHAAAFKHVSLLELNPLAAIRNNALGSYTLARAAIEHAVPRLVAVSTDKAVHPHSIMGASKRLVELTMSALSGPQCRMHAVRLVNVTGSPGSVAPIFESQIARGGPVTVTHPDATRYFMSLDAAVDAILSAGHPECSGKILVPAVAPAQRIVDLAHRLIGERGASGGRQIAIQFIGLRPGEKLAEDLTYTAEKHPTAVELHRCMEQIGRQVAEGDLAGAISTIRTLIPEYQPSAAIAGGGR